MMRKQFLRNGQVPKVGQGAAAFHLHGNLNGVGHTRDNIKRCALNLTAFNRQKR